LRGGIKMAWYVWVIIAVLVVGIGIGKVAFMNYYKNKRK
jgi:hypothetical protein